MSREQADAPPLDLDAIEATLDTYHRAKRFEDGTDAVDFEIAAADIVETVPALVAEVRRLRADYMLATDAKRLNDRYAKARSRNNELAAEVRHLRARVAALATELDDTAAELLEAGEGDDL